MTTYEDIYKKMITEGNSMDWSNALNRSYAIPLEKYSVFNELSTAEEYALNNPVAYEGQIITVSKDGITKGYVLDSSKVSGLKELSDGDDIGNVAERITEVDEKYYDILFGDGSSISNTLQDFGNKQLDGGFSLDFRDFSELSSNGVRYVKGVSIRNPQSRETGEDRGERYLYVYAFVGKNVEEWTHLSNYQLVGVSKNSCLNATTFEEQNYNTFEFDPMKIDFVNGLYLLYPSTSKGSASPTYCRNRVATNSEERQFNSKLITAPTDGVFDIAHDWTSEFVFKTCSIDKDLYDSVRRIDAISSDFAKKTDLPGKATETEKGTVAVGFTTDDNSKNYAVQLSGDNAYVHVNWTGGSAGDVAVDNDTIKKKTDGTNQIYVNEISKDKIKDLPEIPTDLSALTIGQKYIRIQDFSTNNWYRIYIDNGKLTIQSE